MKTKANKKFILLYVVTVSLVLLVTAFMFIAFKNTDNTVAAGENEIEIKVDKVTTVSVYAFGSGVEFVESTANYDLYTATVGTTVRLQAVNETRIFKNWIITASSVGTTPEINDLTNNIINFEVTADMSDLEVTVNRSNATANDYGKYMMDRFVIVDEAELIALQNILKGIGTDSDFALYYDNPEKYDEDSEKSALKEDLRYGYFLIANNFTVFNEKFTGLGTKTEPFQGIVCGKNNNVNSRIFLTINALEAPGEASYGLFSYLGNEALIRNLNVTTSIGINSPSEDTLTNDEKNAYASNPSIIYAGGLSGVMNKSTLLDVNVSTNIGIDSAYATNIYAGGLFGSLETGSGIDSISDVVYEGTNSSWSIVSSKKDSIINAGLLSGIAKDSYIKDVELVVTNQIVDLKNESITGSDSNSKLYLGNVFGTYVIGEKNITIDDIMIMGNDKESLRAVATNGDSVVGGLVGYVDYDEVLDKNGTLNVDKVYFRVLGGNSEYSASSVETSDVVNLYAGGMFGYIDDNANVLATTAFKERLQEIELDGDNSITVANYLFEGNYLVTAVQNGQTISKTVAGVTYMYGKSIAGGIVGKGYLNLTGSEENRSDLAIASPSSNLVIEAVQSKLTDTTENINDKEHAAAALIYGSVGLRKLTLSEVSNINVYTNNTTIQTIREIGSKAKGDLHTGGFIGYATGSNFANIGLYFNNSEILAKSLSYLAKNPKYDTNSAFCGGFAGELFGNSSLDNIEFAGYDEFSFEIVGTNTNLESIQNTKPGGKEYNNDSSDYKGENYIGGLVGRIKYTRIEDSRFIGSKSYKNYIRMSGHESPDSAFCGGIVGFIMVNENNVPSSVINCAVSDTDINGNATCVDTSYSNPDIYIGGIIGAVYVHGTNSSVEISDCRVNNSNVYALGNEIIATYAGGIIAGATWESSVNIKDCYVVDSSVKANTRTTILNEKGNVIESSAAGIIALVGAGTTVGISNCVVIDTNIDAVVSETIYNNNTYVRSYGAGISGFTEGNTHIPNITNCYSNAIVNATHSYSGAESKVYGIAYYANIMTTTKDVNSTIEKITYKTFTLNDYTFQVVSSEDGTYQIRNIYGSYVRVWTTGQVGTTNDVSRATTFTMVNNHLVYGTNYVSFSGSNSIVLGNSYYDFTSVDYFDTTNNLSTTANQTYYLKKNVKNDIDDKGTAVGTGPFYLNLNTPTNPYGNYDYLYGFDGSAQKLYIEIIDNNASFVVNHVRDSVVTVTATDESTVLAHVWINAKEDGSVDGADGVYKPNHENKEEAASYGWFIFDYVLLYSGDLVGITSNISNINTSYTNDSSVYEHYYGDVNSDDNNEHYLVNSNNNSDIILDNYEELDVVNNVKEFTFKVYDNMLSLNVDFEITHFGANYKLLFTDADSNIIEDAEFKRLYGDATLKLVEKHSSTNNDLYNLVFTLNENITEDTVVFIKFVGGNNKIYCETSFKFNLIANKLELVGVTYADYTPPLNYYDTENELGTSTYPYYLTTNSITKFIPIFTKSNDLVKGTKYILEENIEKCDYEVDAETDLYFDILSSGELKTLNTTGKTGKLTVSHGDCEPITVYFTSTKEINVAYSVTGADVEGLTHATDSTDFYFEQYVRSNYSGIPTSAIITIGATGYDLTDLENLDANILIYEINKDGSVNNSVITEFNADAYGYVIKVDESLLTGNSITMVDVDIEYPIVYTVTLDLQCKTFNDSIPTEQLTKSFKIESGTSFKEYFTIIDGNGDRIIRPDITSWIENAEIFGYVFTGFYLVNDANSIHSYGISFDDLAISEYTVNSSLTFYGRWSYLIELVEASGTHIKTGFNSAFLQEYIGDGFTRAIQIPINANQGYVFRVDTDSHYIGKPGIEAYSVTLDNLGNKVMTEIEIEMYQNNSSLYYISPDKITGYLIIKTTVSNSEVIVGEHTSSITENVTTEDGVITFKYIANHYNDQEKNNQSYIYNLVGKDYNTLPMEFVLDFYKESDYSDLILPDFTEIRVYYNRYVDGSTTPVDTIIGTYTTHSDDRVYLTEFTMLDLETLAFPASTTFGDVLGTSKSVTEIYYFTITPPNGYSDRVKNEIANYIVECGYCDGKSETHQPINYLEGARTKNELANPEDLSEIISPSTDYESSRQYKIYHIVPSRDTHLIDNDTYYTFVDDTAYSVYDIILKDTQKLPDFNYISLYDDHRQSTLESSKTNFAIKELRVKLGYRLGNVAVYGYYHIPSTDSWEWIPVSNINVTSAIYQEYIVDVAYETLDGEGNDVVIYPYAFKIDNNSTNEIRIAQIDILSATNNVLYIGNISDFVDNGIIKDAYDNDLYVYSLEHKIEGDSRHDGKIFMLALQLADKDDEEILISDIIGDIYINVLNIGLDIDHFVYLNEYRGKNTAYLNLTEIIKVLNVDRIDFTITIPSDYQVYSVQLLEVTNEFKPASGEVRVEHFNEHRHYFIDGVCKCGAIDPTYNNKLRSFGAMLAADLNMAGGSTTTTVEEFFNTSGENIELSWAHPEMLYKYKWFFEHIKESITTQATNAGLTSDPNYLNAISLLNKLIVGYEPENIFTSNDFTAGSELIRYYIDGLLNSKSSLELNVPDKYSSFMIDFSSSSNIEIVENKYEAFKNTIVIAAYNNTGLYSGNDGPSSINVVYLCDVGVKTNNSLRTQSKILLNKVGANTYQIIAVGNSREGDTSADNIASKVDWTHAIATVYPVDFEALYGQYVGDYLIIDDDDVVLLETGYNTFVQNIKDMNYDGFFNATIVEDLDSTAYEVPLSIADKTALTTSIPDVVVNQSFTSGKYIVNGAIYTYGTNAFSNIKDAIANSTSGETIYVFAGTYNESITISKENVMIYGPNYNVVAAPMRYDEANIQGTITITGNNVKLNGIGMIGTSSQILIGAVSDVSILNVYCTGYKDVNKTISNTKYTYKVAVYSESSITNLVIKNSYFKGDLPELSNYRPLYFGTGTVTNATIDNNYIDNGNDTNGVAIAIYKIAGIYKIQNNKIVFQSGNNTLYLGTEYNACSEIWIRDNYFTSDQVENTKVATITVQRFTSNSGAIHIVGNTFEYVTGGNTFNLSGCTGKVNIKYNYFKDCTFKITADTEVDLDHNYYSSMPVQDDTDTSETYEIFLDEYNANPTYTNEQRIEDYECNATYN